MYSASLLSGIHEKTNPFLYSPTSATGTGWERTPWHATQRAAWEALAKGDADSV
jgi:hypothetical protein